MQSMVFQWFLVLLPSLSMVFDGFGPLVKRCDGFDGSSWSIPGLSSFVWPTISGVMCPGSRLGGGRKINKGENKHRPPFQTSTLGRAGMKRPLGKENRDELCCLTPPFNRWPIFLHLKQRFFSVGCQKKRRMRWAVIAAGGAEGAGGGYGGLGLFWQKLPLPEISLTSHLPPPPSLLSLSLSLSLSS